MTYYYISIGYLSGYSYPADRAQAWTELKAVVSQIRNRTVTIAEEVMRVEVHRKQADKEIARRAAERFDSKKGLTSFSVVEPHQEASGAIVSGTIVLVSSVEDGDARLFSIRESARRAFCRLVINEMHRRGIEVNLEVR